MSSPAPRSSRGNPSMADIVRSVAALGGLVLLLWLVGQIMTIEPDEPVRPVDYATTAESARQAVDYPLLTPAGLPEGWRSNNVRFVPGGDQDWHLGMLTHDDLYIGLEQSKRSASEMLRQFAEGATADGSIDIGGRSWDVFDGPDGRLTFVEETDVVTTLVTTTSVPRDQVETYLASLTSD